MAFIVTELVNADGKPIIIVLEGTCGAAVSFPGSRTRV